MDTAILAPYFRRIEQRHGLTKNMNQMLRSHPVMIEMIRRAVGLLVQTEELFDLDGSVRMNRLEMYHHLMAKCNDLVREVPVSIVNPADQCN